MRSVGYSTVPTLATGHTKRQRNIHVTERREIFDPALPLAQLALTTAGARMTAKPESIAGNAIFR